MKNKIYLYLFAAMTFASMAIGGVPTGIGQGLGINTNGQVVSPTNFWGANATSISNALNGAFTAIKAGAATNAPRTLYVDGAAGNDSTGNPFKTFEAANAAARDGDTIRLGAGIYTNSTALTMRAVNVVGAGRKVTKLTSFSEWTLLLTNTCSLMDIEISNERTNRYGSTTVIVALPSTNSVIYLKNLEMNGTSVGTVLATTNLTSGTVIGDSVKVVSPWIALNNGLSSEYIYDFVNSIFISDTTYGYTTRMQAIEESTCVLLKTNGTFNFDRCTFIVTNSATAPGFTDPTEPTDVACFDIGTEGTTNFSKVTLRNCSLSYGSYATPDVGYTICNYQWFDDIAPQSGNFQLYGNYDLSKMKGPIVLNGATNIAPCLTPYSGNFTGDGSGLTNTAAGNALTKPESTNLVKAVVKDATNGVLAFVSNADWPTTNKGPVVFNGGVTNFLLASPVAFSNSATGGRTYINVEPGSMLRQSGTIKHIAARLSATTAGFKFKVFRDWGGGTYAMISESEAITGVLGSNLYTLSTPLTCLEQDRLGIWATNGATVFGDPFPTNGAMVFLDGDQTAAPTFTGSSTNFLSLKPYIEAPVLAYVGHSIMAGWNYHIGWGDYPVSLPSQQTWNTMPYIVQKTNGVIAPYKVYARGSVMLDYINTNLTAQAAADGALVYIVDGGVNDVGAGYSTARMMTNVAGIRGKIASTNRLYLVEQMPVSGWSDANCVALRTLNTNLHLFAATNANTYVIKCHDRMGVIKGSTGYYDTLNPTFDSGDGTHPNLAGYVELANIISECYGTFWRQNSNNIYGAIAGAIGTISSGSTLTNWQGFYLATNVDGNLIVADPMDTFPLINWQLALSKTQSTNYQAPILFIGDSWFQQNYISGFVATNLWAKYGNAGQYGWATTYNGLWYHPFITASNGTWTTAQNYVSSSTSGDSFWWTNLPCKSGTIYFYIEYGGGIQLISNSIPIGGKSVAAGGPEDGILTSVNFDFLNYSTTNSIGVKLTNTSYVYIYGVLANTGSNGVSYFNLGKNGSTIADWPGGALKNIYTNMCRIVQPDLSVINLGFNDVDGGIFAGWWTNAATLRNYIQSNATNSSLLWVSPADMAVTNGTTSMRDLEVAVRTFALTNSFGYLDGYHQSFGYGKAKSMGLTLDTKHFNALGGAAFGRLIYKRIAGAIGTPANSNLTQISALGPATGNGLLFTNGAWQVVDSATYVNSLITAAFANVSEAYIGTAHITNAPGWLKSTNGNAVDLVVSNLTVGGTITGITSGGGGTNIVFAISATDTNLPVLLSTNSTQTISATTNLLILPTNMVRGAEVILEIQAGITDRLLYFPTTLVWLGSPAPTLLASNHIAWIKFFAVSNTVPSVRAFYAPQIP